MLSKKTFLEGVTILQKMFLNWTFNSKDPLQMQLWYEAFKGVEDKKFMDVIATYCKTRIHPPMNPNEILMVLSEEIEKNYLDPDRAFQKVRELIRDYGWMYGSKDIYSAISDNPALTKTVKDMESELRSLTSDDTFTPERFRKAYAVNLKAMCIRKRDEQLSLTANQIHTPIESTSTGGFLPYET